MAGIGEASAILAVAHIGISLSNTLIAYVSEVQDAPHRIHRIGNEILTTSERLKDIGELVETNGKTQTLSNKGVQSAVRCSADCEIILNQLQGVLKKGGWQQRSDLQEKEEIDTSLFSFLRWPFSKAKLEVPLAELTRVKLDLMLLFSSAMALGASSTSEKAKFRKDIPGLSRTREWAARKAEQAKEWAKDRERDPYFIDRNLDFPQAEPEMLQDFADFQERRMREQEEKKLAEHAALLLVEQEASKKKAEEERRELEEEILNKHKKDQVELEARTAQQKQDLRIELGAAGLEQEQIDIVLACSQLNFRETNDRLNVPADRPMNAPATSENDREGMERTIRKRSRLGIKRIRLPWTRSETSSVNSLSGIEIRSQDSSGCEAWVLNAHSRHAVPFPSSEKWLAAQIDKALKHGGAWKGFARLDERFREEILWFLNTRKQDWSLLSVGNGRFLGTRGFISFRHNLWVLIIIMPPRRSIDGAEEEIDTSSKSPRRRSRAPTVKLGSENGYNGEGERMGSHGEDGNVVQGRSEPLQRHAGDVEWIPPREEQERRRDPRNRGPPPPPPTFIPHDYGPPPRRSIFIPHSHNPSQNQQLVLRDTEQHGQPRPPQPTSIPPPRRDPPNESGQGTWGPPREVGPQLSFVEQERPPRYYASDSDGKISFSGRPSTVPLDPHMSNRERALVRRPGGPAREENRRRERVERAENDIIRLRGEDFSETPVVAHGRTRRSPTSKKTERQVQNRRHKAPAQERLHRNKYDTSEEEDYVPILNPPTLSGSGVKLTDEELILKNLRRFTTFQGDVHEVSPDDIAISSTSKTSSSSSASITSSCRRRAQDREQESALDRRFTFHDGSTGMISEEPTAMTGEDEFIDVLGPNAAKPPNELAQKSSAVNVASVHHDTGTDAISGPEPDDEITSPLRRRARFQGDEGFAQDPGKIPIKRSATEPISKARPSITRSATVEDFGPEGED